MADEKKPVQPDVKPQPKEEQTKPVRTIPNIPPDRLEQLNEGVDRESGRKTSSEEC